MQDRPLRRLRVAPRLAREDHDDQVRAVRELRDPRVVGREAQVARLVRDDRAGQRDLAHRQQVLE